MTKWKSHGPGLNYREKLSAIGNNVVIENGVRIFFPKNIEIDDNVYIGHDTILKAYFDKKLTIGTGTWIGPQCFIYAAGGIRIGENVSIGPGVKILSSAHSLNKGDGPILHHPLEYASVSIGDGADIGANSVITMGVNIGKNVQIGANTVVSRDILDNAIASGIPAKITNIPHEITI
jgi:acetyltransferase-like isoleucine patch superfamily enzyme